MPGFGDVVMSTIVPSGNPSPLSVVQACSNFRCRECSHSTTTCFHVKQTKGYLKRLFFASGSLSALQQQQLQPLEQGADSAENEVQHNEVNENDDDDEEQAVPEEPEADGDPESVFADYLTPRCLGVKSHQDRDTPRLDEARQIKFRRWIATAQPVESSLSFSLSPSSSSSSSSSFSSSPSSSSLLRLRIDEYRRTCTCEVEQKGIDFRPAFASRHFHLFLIFSNLVSVIPLYFNLYLSRLLSFCQMYTLPPLFCHRWL